jgi:hypothetical protein
LETTYREMAELEAKISSQAAKDAGSEFDVPGLPSVDPYEVRSLLVCALG